MSILVTRPATKGAQLTQQLQALGYAAHHTPLINISSGTELHTLSQAINTLNEGDSVIALSPNAIIQCNTLSLQWPDYVNYFAIGYATARELAQHSGQVVYYPQKEISEALLALPQLHEVANKTIWLLRGNGGRELIKNTLTARGGKVICYECYRRDIIDYNSKQLTTDWQTQGVNTIIVTSAQILDRLYVIMQESGAEWLKNCHLIVVSERIAQLAVHYGWSDISITHTANNLSIIDAVKNHSCHCLLVKERNKHDDSR